MAKQIWRQINDSVTIVNLDRVKWQSVYYSNVHIISTQSPEYQLNPVTSLSIWMRCVSACVSVFDCVWRGSFTHWCTHTHTSTAIPACPILACDTHTTPISHAFVEDTLRRCAKCRHISGDPPPTHSKQLACSRGKMLLSSVFAFSQVEHQLQPQPHDPAICALSIYAYPYTIRRIHSRNICTCMWGVCRFT